MVAAAWPREQSRSIRSDRRSCGACAATKVRSKSRCAGGRAFARRTSRSRIFRSTTSAFGVRPQDVHMHSVTFIRDWCVYFAARTRCPRGTATTHHSSTAHTHSQPTLDSPCSQLMTWPRGPEPGSSKLPGGYVRLRTAVAAGPFSRRRHRSLAAALSTTASLSRANSHATHQG